MPQSKEPSDPSSVTETTGMEVTDTDLEATTQDAYDEEVDHQISRMMGEGGVAPPVRPRKWTDWAEDKANLKEDNEQALKD